MTKKGFTLIELLVVISIIGVLATVVFVSFSTAQKQARDTQRKSDLRQYQAALENYANKATAMTYPSKPNAVDVTTIFATLVLTSPCPTDPKSGNVYSYVSDDKALTYSLWATLENATGNWIACSNGKSGLSSSMPDKTNVCPI